MQHVEKWQKKVLLEEFLVTIHEEEWILVVLENGRLKLE
jgi:hypothetical protein